MTNLEQLEAQEMARISAKALLRERERAGMPEDAPLEPLTRRERAGVAVALLLVIVGYVLAAIYVIGPWFGGI